METTTGWWHPWFHAEMTLETGDIISSRAALAVHEKKTFEPSRMGISWILVDGLETESNYNSGPKQTQGERQAMFLVVA